jgi:DNA-binding transcriptional regulator YiaG
MKKNRAARSLRRIAGRPLTLHGLLESIRLSEEMSQAVFAKRLGNSSSHLYDIEKGRKVVSL